MSIWRVIASPQQSATVQDIFPRASFDRAIVARPPHNDQTQIIRATDSTTTHSDRPPATTGDLNAHKNKIAAGRQQPIGSAIECVACVGPPQRGRACGGTAAAHWATSGDLRIGCSGTGRGPFTDGRAGAARPRATRRWRRTRLRKAASASASMPTRSRSYPATRMPPIC
jgi:hypothetical protein